MSHEIYLFGSICRGESTPTSDVDVLVVPFEVDSSRFPQSWSVYSPELLAEYFKAGRLFAWHLHLEAKCVYSSRSESFLATLGPPAPYSTIVDDIDDLDALLNEALTELASGTENVIYELGIVYTAIRDLAMSVSWSLLGSPCFSADAPYRLPLAQPLPRDVYHQTMVARHASTRGSQVNFDPSITAKIVTNASLENWVASLREAI
ncbi:nucleotidyltransferase domain-containing protein [Aeromonas hydrophila]|uniref:nucleotidyltransferase domain-containing protein n=1 Tax=Aeromonas hydrophila TaxID=644 RepID=UPI001CDC6974|nr:nucleotidyltransferase domain-containing protein [Aeromonas hydrophila]MCA4698436.1 nucleotidyltransferase domain-containing protein [Aeromonas hydrophila]